MRDKLPFPVNSEACFPLSRAYTRPPHSLFPERNDQKSRTQRFEQTLELLSTHASQARSKRPSPQVRSSAWLYLFDLAMYPEQLERASTFVSQFVDSGRQFRVEHSTAFVREWFWFEHEICSIPGIVSTLSNILITGRCVELRSPELALTIFNNRPVYRMDLTLPAARQLLYSLHEGRTFPPVQAPRPLFGSHQLRASHVCLPS
jgi:hypothetical protein